MKVRCVTAAFVCAVLFAGLAASPVSAAVSTLPATSLSEAGYQALAAGDATRALPLFTSAIESRQLSPDALANALFNRGLAYQKLGQGGNAADDYTAALNLDAMPSNLRAKVLYNRGIANQSATKPGAAIEDFTSALLLDSSFSYAYLARANALRDSGQYLFAVSDYERALKYHHPDQAHVYLGEAQTFEKLKRPVEAKKFYQEALKADPTLGEAAARIQALGSVAESDDMASDPVITASIASNPSATTHVVGAALPKAVEPPAALSAQAMPQPQADEADADGDGLPEAPAAEQNVLVSSIPGVPTQKETTKPAMPKPAVPKQAVAVAAPVAAPAAAPVAAAKPAAPKPVEVASAEETTSDIAPAAAPAGGWVVQISSAASESLAWDTWKKLSSAHKVLATSKPIVQKAEVDGKGTVYRLRLPGFENQKDAQAKCGKLQDQGVSCYVSKTEG